MLTKKDLNEVLDQKLKPIHNDIKILQKDITIVKKGVKKLQKDVDGVIFMSNRGLISVQKRIVTIEKSLKIPSPEFV